MQQLSPQKDYAANAATVLGIICFALILMLTFVGLAYFKAESQLRFLHGKVLDLPEEISVIKDSIQPMQAYSRNDTTFIEFPNQ